MVRVGVGIQQRSVRKQWKAPVVPRCKKTNSFLTITHFPFDSIVHVHCWTTVCHLVRHVHSEEMCERDGFMAQKHRICHSWYFKHSRNVGLCTLCVAYLVIRLLLLQPHYDDQLLSLPSRITTTLNLACEIWLTTHHLILSIDVYTVYFFLLG